MCASPRRLLQQRQCHHRWGKRQCLYSVDTASLQECLGCVFPKGFFLRRDTADSCPRRWCHNQGKREFSSQKRPTDSAILHPIVLRGQYDERGGVDATRIGRTENELMDCNSALVTIIPCLQSLS